MLENAQDQPNGIGVGTKLCLAGILVVLIAPWLVNKQRESVDTCNHSMNTELEELAQHAVEIEEESKQMTIGETFNQKLADFTSKLQNALLTPEMADAFETIKFVFDNIKKFDMEAQDYKSFTFLLMALVKKAQDSSEFSTWQRNLPGKTEIESAELEQARRYGAYAINVYPASWGLTRAAIARQMNITEDAIQFVHVTDHDHEAHCPKFLMFLDHEMKSVVLAIRGTFSVKDVILDIVCEEVPFLAGFAHKGILNGAHRILAKVEDKLRKCLEENPGYRVVVTGHSLGAGTAELITLELLHGHSSNIIPVGSSVACIALAPPPVYRADTALSTETKEAIQIFINNYDCVPRLSLASVARLLASIRAVDNLSLTLSQQFAILAERKEEEVERNFAKVIQAVAEARQEKFPFLQHPGKIFYLKQESADAKEQIVFQQESQTFSGAILLLDNMITDHLQPRYQEALDNAQAR